MSRIITILDTKIYPGRGIVMGLTPDNKQAVIGYLIMGRSENSRNRVFVADGEDIKTQIYDENLVSDPSLIIYKAVKVCKDSIIISNGTQTDEIADLMHSKGLTFEQAAQTLEFEPDAPHYTPRISAFMDLSNKEKPCYKMAIAKPEYDNNPNSCKKHVFSYYTPLAGKGHFINTYRAINPRRDNGVLPSFAGEPTTVDIVDDIDDFFRQIWRGMNPKYRISAFARYIDLETGKSESRIRNENK